MKRKTKVKLLILSVACLSATLIAGCGELTKEEYLKKNDAENQSVIYFANGGKFKGDRDEMELYYKADSPIMLEPDADSKNRFKVERTDYTFDAWYYTMVGSDGKLMLDADGNPVYGAKVDATDKIGAGEHKYVIAKWNANIAIDVVLVTDGITVTDGEKTYNSGDIINTLNFGTSETYGFSEANTGLTSPNATYLYMFEDEECTKPINAIAKPASGDENVKVYAKYIDSKWTVVSNARAARNMLNASSGNYYLFTPDGNNVINCNSETVQWKDASHSSSIVIEGNGITLENVKLNAQGISGGEYSMLGKLTADASIKDLTIKNASLTANVRSGTVEFYAFCLNAEDGATLENVAIDGLTVTVSGASSASFTNLEVENIDNWLFGGYTTDDNFIEKFGIKAEGLTLKFKGETVFDNISKSQED